MKWAIKSFGKIGQIWLADYYTAPEFDFFSRGFSVISYIHKNSKSNVVSRVLPNKIFLFSIWCYSKISPQLSIGMLFKFIPLIERNLSHFFCFTEQTKGIPSQKSSTTHQEECKPVINRPGARGIYSCITIILSFVFWKWSFCFYRNWRFYFLGYCELIL